jgi:predicted CoA-substrate-specific enzyme activase
MTAFLGVDVGSMAAKAVIVGADGALLSWAVLASGVDHRAVAEAVAARALEGAGVARAEVAATVGTGYCRRSVPFATRTVTEITCHAWGAHALDPACRGVVDIGGQDSKVIRIGERGDVEDFVMNDRCAAGTGRFLEVMAQALGIGPEDAGAIALAAPTAARISSTCTVFAESEVVGLIAAGADRAAILRGLCRSVAERVAAMAGAVDLRAPAMMTGGVARNAAVAAVLGERLGMMLAVPENPQIVGALGAALLARDGACRRG